ncbi:MAG: glycosyltransferase [Salinisphaera sp.]|jgi:glycosyltransferase involved in cell wall biosynthesis|nr:glycosyltransferase [Salinisphaera sp.]
MTPADRPMRRIAFYLPALAAGGMERVTLVLAEALAARGYAVDIVLEYGTGGYLDRVPPTVGRVVLSRGPKWPSYLALIRAWPREGLAQLGRMVWAGDNYVPLRRLAALVDYMENTRPAVIFAAHGRIPHLALWARRLARVSPRVAIIEHSTYSPWLDTFTHDRRTDALLHYLLSLMRRLYPTADAIVGVSDGVSDDLAAVADIPRSRITTIYNPVVTPDIEHLAAQPVDHPWFAAGQPPVVLAVGRLVEEKDFKTLVEAFARMRGKGVLARLVLLGDGEERARLLERAQELGIAEDLDMPGWVDNPYAYMARAGVFVLSSLFEGLPVALIEALACGCPVAATDCPSGPREILDHGAYGPLAPVGDAGALGKAMEQVLTSPLPRAQLTARGAYFSVDRAADSYQALIDRLIGNDS